MKANIEKHISSIIELVAYIIDIITTFKYWHIFMITPNM
jgi:hypothetical protein